MTAIVAISQVNKQRTGGWNSGAVALPVLTISNTTSVFLHSEISRAKWDIKRYTFSINNLLVTT